ncbi:hypothetical protein [Allobaculum mucilyticum]|uniref:hypothetical protein n=1 Tax=Allobaculum mucilyticum TaxID=2834459 RepID=UPI001E303134|nr:hypothetical protein [Allobaculum mucilyticum]UNT97215.1 hypothetical protein KWG62_05630 [Allobaculum mucilyticum]
MPFDCHTFVMSFHPALFTGPDFFLDQAKERRPAEKQFAFQDVLAWKMMRESCSGFRFLKPYRKGEQSMPFQDCRPTVKEQYAIIREARYV